MMAGTSHLATRISRYEVRASSRTSIRLRYVSTKTESRLMCLSRQAQLRAGPTLYWGMAPAALHESKCIAHGDAVIVKEVTRRRVLADDATAQKIPDDMLAATMASTQNLAPGDAMIFNETLLVTNTAGMCGDDLIGGRFLDMADDPSAGVTLVYGRRSDDANQLYLQRLAADGDSWSDPALIATGDHDDRVYPAHSFKFTAALARREVTVWASDRSIHIVLDGTVIRTRPSRLSEHDLRDLLGRVGR